MTPPPPPAPDAPLSAARKWAITFSVMMVTVMQVLDTSITNVALPHMQGSFSASIDEMSWVITSYLAANAVIIPASGWLTSVFGRRRFYLICTVIFTTSSFLSGIAPNLEFLVAMRILQGLGGGPVIPMAQAIMWEIFPLRERGTAHGRVGLRHHAGADPGADRRAAGSPTTGRGGGSSTSTCRSAWSPSSWSARSSSTRRSTASPAASTSLGIVLMMLGFGCLQLVLDLGERQDWFDSTFIVTLSVLAVCMLTGVRHPRDRDRGADPRPERLPRPQLRRGLASPSS